MKRFGRWLPLLLLVVLLAPVGQATAAPLRFREVARLPLLPGPELSEATAATSGWLVLDPATRRGYQLFEGRLVVPGEGVQTRTVVQSFDLDTLTPRRRAHLDGAPITGGTADTATVGGTVAAGEVVHAVDPHQGKVFLALSRPSDIDQQPGQFVGGFGSPPDGQRPFDRVVAVDEAAFDGGAESFATTLAVPPQQAWLSAYWLVGMRVPAPGKLLVLFAQPDVAAQSRSLLVDHTLTQWDLSGDTPTVDWEQRLHACAGASLASPGAYPYGSYQWGLLVTPSAVWTACSGAVVAVRLDEAGRASGEQTRIPVGVRISDVLVDDANDRLLVRSFGGATRLLVFDARAEVAIGTVTVKETDYESAALGVDPATGRLYALVPDHEADGTRVAGGFLVSDPPAELTNVDRRLAAQAVFRIQVDPVTQRIFVRRGSAAFGGPVEMFYRVLQERTNRP